MPRVRVSPRATEAALYAGAAISYVALGVFFVQLVEVWMVGLAWLLLWAWGVPTLIRRSRR